MRMQAKKWNLKRRSHFIFFSIQSFFQIVRLTDVKSIKILAIEYIYEEHIRTEVPIHRENPHAIARIPILSGRVYQFLKVFF